MKKISACLTMVLLIATTFFITSCSTKDTPQYSPAIEQSKPPTGAIQSKTQSPKDYFPLRQGSTWEYRGEGNEYASFFRKVSFVEGDRAQVIEDNGGTVSASIFQTTEEAIVRTFFQGEEYDERNLLDQVPNDKLIILKTPFKVGEKWETSEGFREIIAIDAIVDTPAGRFENCIKVAISSQDATLYEYFKEGIGMVKREFRSGDMIVTSTLEKYSIK